MHQKSLKLNAVLNIVKQLCQVLFPLISIPYITRVLQPENYGKYNYGNSIVSYFVLIAALGITTYSMREGVAYRNDSDQFSQFASEIFSINVISTLFSYGLLSLVLLIPAMEPYRRLIAIQSIVILLTTLGTDWINTIYEDFLYITIRYIVFQIISICLMFLFVRKPDDYLIYAAIVVGSSAGANLLNFFHVRKYARVRFTCHIDWNRHLPPIFVFFANILAISIYVNSDITMLGLMKGDVEVGIYTLASKIYSIIKQILNAVIIVTVPRLSLLIKQDNRLQFDRLALRVQKMLIMMVFPATVGVAFLSSEIMELIGGTDYMEGSTTLALLSGAIAFSLLATFYTSCIMIPLKLERYVLITTILAAAVNISLNIVFIPYLGTNGAAITTLISEALVCFIGGYYTLKSGKTKIEFSFIMKVLVGSLFIVIICTFMKFFELNVFYRTFFTVWFSVAVYFLVEMLIRNQFLIDESKSLLMNLKYRMNRR